jgi:tetratricopeptide (TPR) repeat protein
MNEPTHLFLEIEPGSEAWTVTAPALSQTPHVVANPLQDARFLGEVRELREWASRPIVQGDPLAAGTRDCLDRLSRQAGERITTLLLSEPAREALVDELRRAAGRRVRLTIRVRDCGPLGDEALALPWELLAPEPGAFALRSRALQLIREVVTEGAPDLPAPDASLAVAVMIAAPEDRTAIPYEEESFRLQLALSPLGHEVAFSDLGGLRDLVQLVEDRAATVIHFSGHGLPGKLLFENELGFAEDIAVEEVQRRLHQVLLNPRRAGSFPRLFFLSSCYGAARGPVSDDSPSTAAALHRRGFSQVLGYFGPLDAELSSRAEETFYGELARGATALAAAETLRDTLARPLGEGGERVYPLAWSQLAVYHRGPDLPLARPGASSEPTAERSRRRMVQVSGLPVLERGFIGRRGLQHEVLRRIRGGQRLIVLQGLGGLGKTALASQIIMNLLALEPPDQLILRCRDLEKSGDPVGELRAQAEEHGRLHALPWWDRRVQDLRKRSPDAVKGFAAVIREVRSERPNLVIYADNAESLQIGPATDASQAFGDWIPGADAWWQQLRDLAEEENGGLILLTTRYGWNDLSHRSHCPIDPLGRGDSLRLIESFDHLRGLSSDVRRWLAEHVDGHPLTLDLLDHQLGILGSSPSSRDDVVRQFFSGGREVLTKELLLDRLWKSISPAAKKHLKVLNLVQIPAPQFVVDRIGPCRQELIVSGLLTQYREQELVGSSLVWLSRWGLHGIVRHFIKTATQVNATRAQHRTIGAAYIAWGRSFRWSLSDQLECVAHLHSALDGNRAWNLCEDCAVELRDRRRYKEALHLLEANEAAGVTGDSLAMNLFHQAQILHLQQADPMRPTELLELAMQNATRARTRAHIFHAMGDHFESQGDYAKGEEALLTALELKGKTFGRRDPETVAALRSLADVYVAQGKFSEAEPLLITALQALEKEVGVENVEYGKTALNIVDLLIKQGEYGPAEELGVEVVKLFDRILMPGDPFHSVALAELAEVLDLRGRYLEAESLWRRAVDNLESSLGANHSAFRGGLYGLASVLITEGKHAEAEEILRRVLDSMGEGVTYRPSSEGTYAQSLAGLLSTRGAFQEAEKLFQGSLEVESRILGERHPHFGMTLSSMGGLMIDQGKYSEAEGTLNKALGILSDHLGLEHPWVGHSLHRLAIALSHQGRYDEAEDLLRKSMAISVSTLGELSPERATILQAMAIVRLERGLYIEAEGLLREALAVVESTLGRSHLDNGMILHALGSVIDLLGEPEEAERLLRQALKIKESVLGEDNLEWADTVHQLALVLSRGKDLLEAERLGLKALEKYERLVGSEHPRLCPALCNVASLLLQRGKAEEGERLTLRALKIGTTKLGASHPETGQVLFMLAQTQAVLGSEEAVQTARAAISVLTETQGSEHPVVLDLVPRLEDIASGDSESLDGYRFLCEMSRVESAAERNDVQAATSAGERLIVLARKTGNSPEALDQLGGMLTSLAILYVDAERFEDARRALEESISLGIQIGSPNLEGRRAALRDVRKWQARELRKTKMPRTAEPAGTSGADER